MLVLRCFEQLGSTWELGSIWELGSTLELGSIARDDGSVNGVIVNDGKIDREVALQEGDRIRIGLTTIVYTLRDDDDAQPSRDQERGVGEWARGTVVPPDRD